MREGDRPSRSWMASLRAKVSYSRSRVKCSCNVLPHFEIRARLEARIVTIEGERAVDVHLLGHRVHAERISTPEHDVRHLSGFERARASRDTQRLRGIRSDPGDGVGGPDLDACILTGR